MTKHHMSYDNKLENLSEDITAVVLTYNEEKHIERCILSMNKFVNRIINIDSLSTDNTLNIIKKYNIETLQNKFVNQSKQLNRGLNNSNIKTEWILRIDADEILTKSL